MAAATPAVAVSHLSVAADRIDSLLIHGSERGQFLAVVIHEAKSDGTLQPVTTIHFRPLGGRGDAWVRFAQFDARALAMGQWGGDLAVLLQTSQAGPGRTQLRYVRNALDRSRGAEDIPGPPLPPGVTLTDIAGGGGSSTLLALGTLGETAAVWTLAGTQWRSLPPLPENVSGLASRQLDLGARGGTAVIAARVADNRLLVLAREQDRWRRLGTVAIEAEEQFQVVSGVELASPTVYIFGTNDRFVRFDQQADSEDAEPESISIEFAAPSSAHIALDTLDPRTAAVSLGSLRVGRVAFTQRGVPNARQVVLELALDPTTFQALGDGRAAVLSFPAMTAGEIRDQLLMLALYGLLVVAVVASLRQRPMPSAESLRTLVQQLAPLSLRAIAGAIDALPLPAATLGWWLSQGRVSETTQWLIVLGGVMLYIGHVMVSEAVGGKSLGKIIFGLRVVRTDGASPGPGAIILRNLLRPLDLPLAGLGMALLNPLSQRLGDIAAGTTVIRAPEPPKPPLEKTPAPR